MNNRSDSSEVKIKSRQGIKIFVAGDSTAADKQPQPVGRPFRELAQLGCQRGRQLRDATFPAD